MAVGAQATGCTEVGDHPGALPCSPQDRDSVVRVHLTLTQLKGCPAPLYQASLALCFILMFGNSMLLTSYYAASLAVIWAIEGFAWLFGTVTLKYLTSRIFGVADDAHISNLLKSKFIGYKDFDTLMYTCAAEFDFMEKEVTY
ncbi:Protein dpy-19 like protein 1 [Chelonia mydas]|uniref:Protein dpy-19 like protein 1 n=1 Tax=Chelonia mydas TaxID=8469 RepID=M7BTH9_CHEMY|nr:Protein dpy-19 like protein 1 [Chelonia mydas]